MAREGRGVTALPAVGGRRVGRRIRREATNGLSELVGEPRLMPVLPPHSGLSYSHSNGERTRTCRHVVRSHCTIICICQILSNHREQLQ